MDRTGVSVWGDTHWGPTREPVKVRKKSDMYVLKTFLWIYIKSIGWYNDWFLQIEMSVLIVQASVVMEPAGIGSEGLSVCVVQGLNQGQTTHAKVSKVSPHFSEISGSM